MLYAELKNPYINASRVLHDLAGDEGISDYVGRYFSASFRFAHSATKSRESPLTGAVQVSHFLGAKLLENMLNLFESRTQGAQAPCSSPPIDKTQNTLSGVLCFGGGSRVRTFQYQAL